MVLIFGDTAPVVPGICADGRRDMVGDKLKEADRERGALGGALSLGCCLIRRRPDKPKPCSPACSGIIGDLDYQTG
jgi:hypothetical protein